MKKMTNFLAALFVATILFGMAPSASAYTIVPADADFTGSSPANPNAAQISSIVGHTVNEYYREDNALVETGTLSGSYNTTFHDDPTTTSAPDWDGGTVTYVPGTPYIDGEYQYFFVRDGNQATPIWYIFDISDWNGTDPIQFGSGPSNPGTGWFWEGQYGISHIMLLGDGTQAKVPEPLTLILYGFGFAGSGLYIHLRRKPK